MELVAYISSVETELLVLLERSIHFSMDTVVGTCETRHEDPALHLLGSAVFVATRGSSEAAGTFK